MSTAHLEATFHHAISRARERYGVALAAKDVHRLSEEIQRGEHPRFAKTSAGDGVFLVPLGGVDGYAVFDGVGFKRITTFISPEQAQKCARYKR